MTQHGGLRNLSVDVSTLPDSVVTQYRYEDDSDTTTALDSVGSNDATVSGATFTTTSKVGGLALSHDGSGDNSQSSNSVDLSSLGIDDGYGIAAWLNVQSSGSLPNNFAIEWGVDTNNTISVNENGNGNLELYAQEGGDTQRLTGPSISTGSYYHAAASLQSDGTYQFIVHDGTGSVIFNDTLSTNHDPTAVGSGEYSTGWSGVFGGNHLEVIVDDFSPANAPITGSDLDALVERGT